MNIIFLRWQYIFYLIVTSFCILIKCNVVAFVYLGLSLLTLVDYIFEKMKG